MDAEQEAHEQAQDVSAIAQGLGGTDVSGGVNDARKDEDPSIDGDTLGPTALLDVADQKEQKEGDIFEVIA